MRGDRRAALGRVLAVVQADAEDVGRHDGREKLVDLQALIGDSC